ncbi:MAG: amidohydrolase family protein [Clostridiales bacterium]|nr:amidohydrolase family protein [Clostridiales bacterium]
MYDLIIENATIPNYKENIFYNADIGILDGKIVKIGNIEKSSKSIINAEGLIVSSGFIDIHMHEEVLRKETEKNYDIANFMLNMGVTTAVGGNCGNNRQPVNEFFGFVDKEGAPINYLLFIGHNFLRAQAGIDDRYREATTNEIDIMRKALLEAIDEGAIGISFGLEYSPGATFDEIIQLLNNNKNKEILLSAHYRTDGEKSLEAVRELIEISKTTSLPMQISHLVSCSAMGYMKESLEIIDKAIDDGVDVLADSYPYNAFSTYIGSAVFDKGCFERWNKDYSDVILLEEPYVNKHCTKELFEKAQKEYPKMLVAAAVMNEEESVLAFCDKNVIIASDGLYNLGKGHPRGSGTFPKVLGQYVREEKHITLLEALYKMTLMPAKRLRLDYKGDIQIGYDADLVIFNKDEIIDKSRFDAPTAKPEGIYYVIINGKIAKTKNIIMNNRAGRIIRRQELKKWRDNFVR